MQITSEVLKSLGCKEMYHFYYGMFPRDITLLKFLDNYLGHPCKTDLIDVEQFARHLHPIFERKRPIEAIVEDLKCVGIHSEKIKLADVFKLVNREFSSYDVCVQFTLARQNENNFHFVKLPLAMRPPRSKPGWRSGERQLWQFFCNDNTENVKSIDQLEECFDIIAETMYADGLNTIKQELKELIA